MFAPLVPIFEFLWNARNVIFGIACFVGGAAFFSSKEALSQAATTINSLWWLILIIAALLVVGKLIDLAKAYVERMPRNEDR